VTRYRILTLGDSCTFGLGVDDAQTWPAQLQQLLNADGDRVEVINAGVPGYSAFQGRRFLEKEGLHLAPDLVIAGFGFNDREVWASRSDYETAHAFADAGYDYWLTDSRAYSCLKTWWHRSKAPAGGRRVPRLNLQEFQATLVAMRDMCAANEIEFATIVWPYEPQVRLGSADREKYQLAMTTLDRTQDIPVISLIEPFIASPTSLFLDHIHANADGCRMAAEEVAEFVSARLP
jgi:lysophospholipase L1-like esterase